MATMILQNIAPSGITPAFAAVATQDVIETGGAEDVFLHVKNDSGTVKTVTITAVSTTAAVRGVGDLPITDHVVSIAAGAEAMIGPFTGAYRDGDGVVTIDYSAIATVTAAALKLKPVG